MKDTYGKSYKRTIKSFALRLKRSPRRLRGATGRGNTYIIACYFEKFNTLVKKVFSYFSDTVPDKFFRTAFESLRLIPCAGLQYNAE